jgi:hypothetical protein
MTPKYKDWREWWVMSKEANPFIFSPRTEMLVYLTWKAASENMAGFDTLPNGIKICRTCGTAVGFDEPKPRSPRYAEDDFRGEWEDVPVG